MSTPMPLIAPAPGLADDPRTRQIVQALDPEFLKVVSWDWERRVILFPRDHPVLGMPDCCVSACNRGARFGSEMCMGCERSWVKSGRSLEEFVRTPKVRNLGLRQVMCRVPACARPAKTTQVAVCDSHHRQRVVTLKVSLEEFVHHPAVVPREGTGQCGAAVCYRLRDHVTSRYCQAHMLRLKYARRRGEAADEEQWARTTSAVNADREVCLRGLADRVVVEFLYGLQARTESGVKTWDHFLRPVADRLREMGAPTMEVLADMEVFTKKGSVRGVVRTMLRWLGRLGASPESEAAKDVWDLRIFTGRNGTLDFTRISQPALRQAVKMWAYDDLPRRRGRRPHTAVQPYVLGMNLLSESLRLQRDDGGLDPAELSRRDIVAFCNRLAFLTETGRISHLARRKIVRNVGLVLTRIRTLGLTHPGQPMAGLSADFRLQREDTPDPPEDAEAGRDLPDAVMRQLCDHLDELEQLASREVRVGTELLMDTGRRPEEIRELPLDCVQSDPDGSLVLVYDNHKSYRLARRLPIGKPTAGVITAQQERVRAMFPGTPAGELKLLPSPRANPHGTKAIDSIGEGHRKWVDSLPDLLVPTLVEEEGQPVTRMLPFDKARIFPYAYRHCYAQRHADAGVAADVLKELMDHSDLKTTQNYYRVSQERRRDAVNRVITLQFDRHGARVWRKAQSLLESEHARRAIGEVSVPYGVCQEPSNVAAGGQSCPIRFRCVGCDHFRTDVSYLPDLQAHLTDLLRSRERLMAAFEADDWARSEAMPSENEISRVRRLIDRVTADVDSLTPEDRAQITEAVSVVRRSRTVMLGMPRTGQPLPDVRPGRTL
ncbi:tyrosine-type recombinase/integrase [Streptomyces sp. NPDC059209]|uniref:tyrosine-type recombinase/integrase n=1 Tax=Streptomyces sp. NPDC059209 TaxID=3346769 RepID=UPI0036AF103A